MRSLSNKFINITTQFQKYLKLIDIFIFLCIITFAYFFNFFAGQRGFFPFDQSIVFDGSYRVFTGQIPFKDFVIPFGPMTFWFQGSIFKLFGVSYASYIFGAALTNALVAGICFWILRIIFPENKLVAWLGSSVTAIWFYPPFGTPWPEQTAFFFAFAALLGTMLGLLDHKLSRKWQRGLFFASGIVAFGAFISKQNAGAFIVPVFALLFIFPNIEDIRKGVIDFIIFSWGWFVGLISFAIWLALQSDISLFFRYFFEIPAQEVSVFRLPESFMEWMNSIFVGEAPISIIVLSLLSSLIAIIVILYDKNTETSPHRVIAAVLAPSLFLYHNVYLITSNNQPENALPFIGVISAIGFGLLSPGKERSRSSPNLSAMITPTMKLITGGIVTLLIAIVSLYGLNVSCSRQVHNIFSNSVFGHQLTSENLAALSWAVPTRVGNLIPVEDVNNIVNYLKTQGENFFVFPDFTILYGTLGVQPPQPLLWFHSGLTYSKTYDPMLDAWIVSALQEHQVRIIIVEEQSWFHTDRILEDFPQLSSFIDEKFVYQQRFGNFLIYIIQNQ
ncbi:MAG: hypothetical protein ISR58_08765 [Anaerolineales bacterium]|nr:hypothetical protein [Chloroflexota bacterium]MBL6981269.1 hypothetical protein [Anaerolineales bacterium]